MLPPRKVNTGICLLFLDVLIYEKTVWEMGFCLFVCVYFGEGGEGYFKNSEFQMCCSFMKLLLCFIFEALGFFTYLILCRFKYLLQMSFLLTKKKKTV